MSCRSVPCRSVPCRFHMCRVFPCRAAGSSVPSFASHAESYVPFRDQNITVRPRLMAKPTLRPQPYTLQLALVIGMWPNCSWIEVRALLQRLTKVRQNRKIGPHNRKIGSHNRKIGPHNREIGPHNRKIGPQHI